MGERGPQRKPRALRLVEGDRGHQKRNAAEPMPPPIEPGRPAAMTVEAGRVWDGLAPGLLQLGVLTEWDGELFGAFCEAVVTRRRAVELIAPGLVLRGREGQVVVNPGWRVFRDATLLVARLGAQFGLSPASRTLLQGNLGGLDADDEDALFTPVWG